MRKAVLFGLAAATDVLLLDQLSKWWVLEKLDIAARAPLEVLPFFNLVMVWNRGISFGMLSEFDAKWLLIGIALVITAIMGNWLRKVEHTYTGISIGLIIGGALGNVIDRLRFGAVADFLDFYVGTWHWPAFNIADASICIGVALLAAESILSPHNKRPPAP